MALGNAEGARVEGQGGEEEIEGEVERERRRPEEQEGGRGDAGGSRDQRALYGLSWMKDRTLFTPSIAAALAMIRSAFD